MVTDLNRYTWSEIAAMDPADMTYILPISSLEQHGRHLAMGADDFILQCALKELYKKTEMCIRDRYSPFTQPTPQVSTGKSVFALRTD